MSDQKPGATQCLMCNRTAALKTNADVLQRLIVRVMRSSPKGAPAAEPSPAQLAAAVWHADSAACLKREMAPHPRCAGCGILMGPGHLEIGTDQQCRSCLERCTPGQRSSDVISSRPKVGRRGWHSDYAIKK